ncbi:hypothetical protein GCM10025882_18780 [Acinetobacter gyllenbergii]|nr:hypothetical protein GCM10025882_18780 [Acinetobacter gyllenbergii]
MIKRISTVDLKLTDIPVSYSWGADRFEDFLKKEFMMLFSFEIERKICLIESFNKKVG